MSKTTSAVPRSASFEQSDLKSTQAIIEIKRQLEITLAELERQLKLEIQKEIRFVTDRPRPLPRSLLTEQETADLLGVSVKTLPVWRHKGQGPDYIKIERSVRYKLSDIHSYLKKQTIRLRQ